MILFAGAAGALHWVDHERIEIPPFGLLFVGPDRLSQFDELCKSDAQVIVFSSLFYNRTNRDAFFLQNLSLFHFQGTVTAVTPPVSPESYYRTVVQLLDTLTDATGQPVLADLAHNIIQQMLIIGLQQSNAEVEPNFTEDDDHVLLLRFRNLIAECFQNEKNVSFYADKLHITIERLNKAVKSCTGKRAKELITDWVIDEARWQLAHSSRSVKEISYLLGFSEENNFSAFFSKNEGKSPKEFRRLHLLKQGSPAA